MIAYLHDLKEGYQTFASNAAMRVFFSLLPNITIHNPWQYYRRTRSVRLKSVIIIFNQWLSMFMRYP